MDNSSAIGGGELKWTEIREIVPYEFMGQPFIGLKLHDTERYLASRTGFQRLLMKANRGMVDAPINIAQNTLRQPLEEIYGIMADKWERANR
ncbi:hypothetical protein N6H14_15600 [Paenibacillus sp. CC-CFT747]|nr:hypothetical protein N6H14_15600 [Paenibacillus sp. CC-CFT747]